MEHGGELLIPECPAGSSHASGVGQSQALLAGGDSTPRGTEDRGST
jgi:hypothetical protein